VAVLDRCTEPVAQDARGAASPESPAARLSLPGTPVPGACLPTDPRSFLSAIKPASIRNTLLNTLPEETLALVLPHLRRVELPGRHTLHAADAPIDAVHFLETGYASTLAVLESGDVAEVGIVGHEGMTGLPLLMEDDRSPLEIIVQSGGIALRMEADAFRRAVDELPALRRPLLRYALALHIQVSVTAACNGRHLLEQRMARWLLMAQDRLGDDEFPMTHEFLSMMLGVRRAGVTVAAGTLQREGLIRYEQGRMRVVDRGGLETVACECHGIVRRSYARLLGGGGGPGRRLAAD